MTDAPTLNRLLSIYWDKHDLYYAAMDRANALTRGTPEHVEAERLRDEASDADDVAAIAIMGFVPTSAEEARQKQSFVALIASGNSGSLYEEHIAALIETLDKIYDPRKRLGGEK